METQHGEYAVRSLEQPYTLWALLSAKKEIMYQYFTDNFVGNML